MPVNCSPTDHVQLFFSIGKTKADAKFLLWVLSYTGNFLTSDTLFAVKKKKQQQQVTLVLLRVARSSITEAETFVHAQITGKNGGCSIWGAQ